MHVYDRVVGARGQQGTQLGPAAMCMVPAEGVDEFVVLLDGAQQLQVRKPKDFY